MSSDTTHLGDLGDPWHVAIVVPDLARAMDELATTLGVSWSRVMTMTNHQWSLRHGNELRTRSFTFSSGTPRFELLQVTPDSIWETPGLHHLAFWVDDVKREADRLCASGFEQQVVSYPLTDGEHVAAASEHQHRPEDIVASYLKHPEFTLTVELVADRIRNSLEEWLSDTAEAQPGTSS